MRHRFWIFRWNALIAAATLLAAPHAALADAYVVEPVDTSYLPVYRPSIAIGPSAGPALFYVKAVQGGPGGARFATRSAGTWIVEPAPGGSGALAFDTEGVPHCVFDLDLVTRHAACYSTRSEELGWLYEGIELLPLGEIVSTAHDLVFDAAGHPHGCYVVADVSDIASRGTYNFLTYVVKRGIVWTKEIVDSGGYFYKASMAVGPDEVPWISYGVLDGFSDLRVANRQGGAWSVEAMGTPMYDSSIAVDGNGIPHLAFVRVPGGLTYAKKTAVGWTFEVVDEKPGAGILAQIALDESGDPWIAYSITNTGELWLARRVDGAWRRQAVLAGAQLPLVWGLTMALDASSRPWLGFSNGNWLCRVEVARWDEEAVAIPTPLGASGSFVGWPYPNPSHGRLSLPLALDQASLVRMRLLDVAGRVVAERPPQSCAAGSWVLAWEPRVNASGVYQLQIESNGRAQARRVTLLR